MSACLLAAVFLVPACLLVVIVWAAIDTIIYLRQLKRSRDAQTYRR